MRIIDQGSDVFPSDVLVLSLGVVVIALLVPLLGIIAWRLFTGEAQPWLPRQLAYSFIGILLVGLGAELWSPATNAPLPAGWGGIFALLIGGPVDRKRVVSGRCV